MSSSSAIAIGSAFWGQQGQRFVRLREQALQQRTLPLGASYHPDGWGLDDVLGFRGRSAASWLLDHGTPAIVDEFKSVASLCAVALGAQNTDTAWVEWLDCLRRDRVEFKAAELWITSHATREPRPEPDFEVLVSGLVREPLEIRPHPEGEVVSTELHEIADVCGASERVCRRLGNSTQVDATRRKISRTRFRHARIVCMTNRATTSILTDGSNRIIRPRELAERIGLSLATIWRLRRRGDMPEPIRLSPGCVGWRLSDTDEWLAARSARRD